MHFADVFEHIADELGSAEALVCGDHRISWQELDERAARLAAALGKAGLGPDSKVALYMYNCNEYVEAYYATLKLRGVGINVNYRYTDNELLYLLDNSDAEALIFHGSLADRVEKIHRQAPKLKLLIEVDDGGKQLVGAVDYEKIIQSTPPAPRVPRSSDDIVMNFTGGTTGMPKGVMYRIGDMSAGCALLAPLLFGINDDISSPVDAASVAQKIRQSGLTPVSLPACPMMHTAGMMNGVLSQMFLGSKVVSLTGRSFDAREFCETVEREKVSFTVIVGDPFCVPILEVLEAARDANKPYDLSSLKIIMSSGVAWSRENKARLLEFGDFQLIDAMGATEGFMGMQINNRASPPGQAGKFIKMAEARVFDENDQEIEPGSGRIGHIAAGGASVPIGYYKDPEKSAKTFRTINGKRYAFIGDQGTIEADGSLTVHGRGSGCINTAGEKVFPEEVEDVLKSHEAIKDCIVTGIPDPKYGQTVAAVVETSLSRAELESVVKALCMERLAGYKRPRTLVIQKRIQRAPNGKPDLPWARSLLEPTGN